MTRIKVCGITRADDAFACARAGVDALGFVFYEKSPRFITVENASGIIQRLPPFVTSVALFVNPDRRQVEDVIASTGVDLLQFHGDEDEGFCNSFSRPFIKAIRMSPGLDASKEIRKFSFARGILLDAYDPVVYGGTGHSFDWSRARIESALPIILAGGLTSKNVSDAILQCAPWGVDVSGGVEISKGIKDHALIDAFVRGAKRGQTI